MFFPQKNTLLLLLLLLLLLILVLALRLLVVLLRIANAILKRICDCLSQQVSVVVVLKAFIVETVGSNLAGTSAALTDYFVVSLNTPWQMERWYLRLTVSHFIIRILPWCVNKPKAADPVCDHFRTGLADNPLRKSELSLGMKTCV
jgi:hypothetical protein